MLGAAEISKADEERLCKVVKQAYDLVDGPNKLDPTAAILKAAKEAKLLPGEGRVAANAYNNGRQTFQRKSHKEALLKFATFPLADPDQVAQGLGETKQASFEEVDPVYLAPPLDPGRPRIYAGEFRGSATAKFGNEKQAAAKESGHDLQQDLKQAGIYKRAQEEARFNASEAKLAVERGIQKLSMYFDSMAPRVTMPQAKLAARTYYGEKGEACMALVAHNLRLPNIHETGAHGVRKEGSAHGRINLSEAPFSYIRDCIKAGEEYHRWKAAEEEIGQRLTKLAADKNLWAMVGKVPPAEEAGAAKEANVLGFGVLAAGASGLLNRTLTSIPKSYPQLLEEQLVKLQDPEHENEMRRVRAQAMLTRMMTDPDNPISGHDPDKVMSAYNQISKMAPRLADQEGTVGPWLQRMLAGQMQPFEAKEIVDTESKIRDAKGERPGAKDVNVPPATPNYL